jgi:hypothetical protein
MNHAASALSPAACPLSLRLGVFGEAAGVFADVRIIDPFRSFARVLPAAEGGVATSQS